MSRPRRESTARVPPALIEPTAPTRSRSISNTQIRADRISASIASIFAPAFARRYRTARSGDALAGMDASTFRAFRNRGAFAPHEQTKTTTDDPSRRPSFRDAERATRSTADQASHSVPVGRSQSPRRLDGWPEETRHINIGARTVHWRRSHTRATLQALMWSGVVATSCWCLPARQLRQRRAAPRRVRVRQGELRHAGRAQIVEARPPRIGTSRTRTRPSTRDHS